jgi:hypothetical protein
VLAGESDDRLDIAIRVRDVWDMPRVRKRNYLYARQRVCEPGNYRREGERALAAECEEGWLREPSNPFEVVGKLLWIVRLIEKGWCILGERLLELGRQLSPRPAPKRHCVDELFGGARMVAGGDSLHYSSDPLAHFLWYRRYGRVIGKQREQRRLMAEKASEKVGKLASHPNRD